jgi:nuclear-control-of-ATPase protein 2
VRRLDAQLDKFQISAAQISTTASHETARTVQLKNIIRSLSTTSSSRPLLTRSSLRQALSQTKAGIASVSATGAVPDENDLEWLIAGKATVQTYGLLLNTFLAQTIPLGDEIWYWDDVLGSYANTGLYTIQTAPGRFWRSAKEIYADAKQKYTSSHDGSGIRESSQSATQSLSQGWRDFYALVQDSIQDRSLMQARTRILSPFALCRTEARKKQNGLKRLREMSATAIGLLIDEGLTFQHYDEEDKNHSKGNESPDLGQDEWRITVARSVSLLESVLTNVNADHGVIADFEESVFSTVEAESNGLSPRVLTDKLIHILDQHLPDQENTASQTVSSFGRPSRLVRYWIPGTVLLLSGSTLLRIFANRKTEIRQWIEEFGQTVIDFWSNWVIEPTKKLIGTIRHDEESEVAIMSKDSLKADRASLERMVVDFAVDHPEDGTAYTEAQVANIRAKVKQGDLTPVLRAYERDLAKPFMGTVRGDLIRALLIQVQKTKVDVEVAIGGIDALLKSQELLFGFVGIAPGVLISFAAFRWLGGLFGSRKGLNRIKKQGDTIRLLRNIDRTLNNSSPTNDGMLSYKDHGLLLCEVHLLRERAAAVLPGNVHREFVEDINDLIDIRNGVKKQIKVVGRIQWAYSKWLK